MSFRKLTLLMVKVIGIGVDELTGDECRSWDTLKRENEEKTQLRNTGRASKRT